LTEQLTIFDYFCWYKPRPFSDWRFTD